MKNKRYLAMLCAVSLCCMSFSGAVPAMAEETVIEEIQAAEEEAARRKAAEEEAARKAAEEEAARKAAEEEAARKKAAEEEAARKAAEEEAARKAAEEEAARKAAEEEEAARKAAEEEALRKAEADRKAAEEEAARRLEEEKKALQEAEEQKKAGRKPTPTPTAKPDRDVDEEPTELPTEEPTPAPTMTVRPSESPSPAPTDSASPAPTETVTPVPSEDPTQEPTEQPTEEPTEGPTATPLPPVTLSAVTPSSDRVIPGKKVSFSYTAQNAEIVTWSALRSDGVYGGSGTATDGSFVWKPEVSGIYTVTVNATAGELTVSSSCQVTVRRSALKVSAKGESEYAVSGQSEMVFKVKISGGCEPYSCDIVVNYKDTKIFEAHEPMSEVVVQKQGYGKNVLEVVVTDALGETKRATASILSSGEERNDHLPLPRLTRDMTFAEKVVAVAWSQVGYREMQETFGYKEEDGTIQGWTYYGAWYGMPYEEWCAMFVSYCLRMSGIHEGILPQSANCNRWRWAVGAQYIDDEDEYIPEPGDLIFYHHDRVSHDPNFPNHIGIVVDYDPEKDIVYTVEGNSNLEVRYHECPRDYSAIVGYVSMRYYMNRYDQAYLNRLNDTLAADLALIKGNTEGAARNRAKMAKAAH